MPRFSSLTILPLAALLAACSVTSQEGDQITIEHLANQFVLAQTKAEEYCADKGKTALQVQAAPSESSASFLMMRTTTSTFRCVDAPRK